MRRIHALNVAGNGEVHNLHNCHYLRVFNERSLIFELMVNSNQVGYENMENYNFGHFCPLPPLGGGEIGKNHVKSHIFDELCSL